MRILVVDEDVEIRHIRQQLEPCGIEVIGASDADAAFHIWQTQCPWDLVVTEYNIKAGIGIRDARELVNAIRVANPSQRVAIHTNDRGLLVAPVPAFRKPCPVEHLLRMLRPPVLSLHTLSEKQRQRRR